MNALDLPTFDLPTFDAFIFAVFLLGFGFACCWFAEQAEAMLRTVSCRCGHKAHDILILDDTQADELARSFTQQCPICRCNARSAAFESSSDSGHSPAIKEHVA